MMSTRSQIEFVQKREWEEDGEEKSRWDRILTYKHHDGYPEGTVPVLREYYNWSTRTQDLEYFVATWFYWNKRRSEKWHLDEGYSEEPDEDDFEVPREETGFGVCPGERLHGDIEYLWIVDITNETIHMYDTGIRDAETVTEVLENHDSSASWDLSADPEVGLDV